MRIIFFIFHYYFTFFYLFIYLIFFFFVFICDNFGIKCAGFLYYPRFFLLFFRDKYSYLIFAFLVQSTIYYLWSHKIVMSRLCWLSVKYELRFTFGRGKSTQFVDFHIKWHRRNKHNKKEKINNFCWWEKWNEGKFSFNEILWCWILYHILYAHQKSIFYYDEDLSHNLTFEWPVVTTGFSLFLIRKLL